MDFKKLHWILAAVVLVVALARLATGNLLGALLPLVLAAVFASIAADYPLLERLRRAWRWARRIF